MLELFLVSMVYWIAILVLFVWLNRRVEQLTWRLALLERDGAERED